MEDVYIIKGGKKLQGTVMLSGAKNVALKTITAALMFDQEVVLTNIPRINDVFELLHLINLLGAKAEFTGKNIVVVDGGSIKSNRVDFLHGSKVRTSFLLFAPLLHRFNRAYIPNPGGCRIGARPIDRIIDGMTALGIETSYDSETGFYCAEMKRKPSGTYRFVKPSHTGTELLMLIGALSEEQITIENSGQEPEIDNLIDFLNQSGTQIKRVNHSIIVRGVKKLTQQKPFTIMSDRNEAITYAVLGLCTKGEIIISGVYKEHISALIDKVKQTGGDVSRITDQMWKFSYKKTLVATDVETTPHPGFMTDWQPLWTVLMTQAQGRSIITERLFENRFAYVEELRKLGAVIDFIKTPAIDPVSYFFFNFDPHKQYNQTIKVEGPQTLHGGVLTINDLRAGATLAIAALVAEGESYINGVSILERGYEDFVEKITSLGGSIRQA